MTGLGIALVIVGGVTFAAVIVFYLAQYSRTHVLFQTRKAILFPVAVLGWIAFVAGALIWHFASVTRLGSAV